MTDEITKLGSSLIQHGHYNKRIYLMELTVRDIPEIIGELDSLAQEKGYTKVFARVPASAANAFEQSGYRREAIIPGFFRGVENAVFLGKYFSRYRGREKYPEQTHHVLVLARQKSAVGTKSEASKRLRVSVAGPSDVEEMSLVYNEVFATYPFPISEPGYLHSTMDSRVRYFCARKDDRIVALASADMDHDAQSVEMTDFATLTPYRRSGLALRLLEKMEEEMRKEQMLTAYTIARALSAGMNITFARAGYSFAGTLINNTNISGHIESMNVWYKRLG